MSDARVYYPPTAGPVKERPEPSDDTGLPTWVKVLGVLVLVVGGTYYYFRRR